MNLAGFTCWLKKIEVHPAERYLSVNALYVNDGQSLLIYMKWARLSFISFLRSGAVYYVTFIGAFAYMPMLVYICVHLY